MAAFPTAKRAATIHLEKWVLASCVRMARRLPPAPIRAAGAARDTPLSIIQPIRKNGLSAPISPNGDNAGDSLAVLLPNGNVLVLGDSGTRSSSMAPTLPPRSRGRSAAHPGPAHRAGNLRRLLRRESIKPRREPYDPVLGARDYPSSPKTVTRGSDLQNLRSAVQWLVAGRCFRRRR